MALDSLFQKPPMFAPQKKRTVKAGDAFENTQFQQWFENVRGCREADLHIFVKQILRRDSWHQVDSDRCNFHPLIPALSLVSLLERYLVLETPMPRGDIRNARLYIYSLWFSLPILQCSLKESVEINETRFGKCPAFSCLEDLPRVEDDDAGAAHLLTEEQAPADAHRPQHAPVHKNLDRRGDLLRVPGAAAGRLG